MWFETLTGFTEESPEQVRSNLVLDGADLVSQVNGRRLGCGRLEVLLLSELRDRLEDAGPPPEGSLAVRELVADAQSLHADPVNAGAVFQVASQFNLLEMVSPQVTPEEGVGIYEYDPTQGPACAIAAGGGLIYRNYFVPLGDHLGQTSERQLDTLANLGNSLGNRGQRLWRMLNGYALATEEGLREISATLAAADDRERRRLEGDLAVGVHWDVQVTLGEATHSVTQVYCSALPVAYSERSASEWEPFARLVLDAAYEATLTVAALNLAQSGRRRLYLTLLGGGAFGNDLDWIIAALRRSFRRFQDWPLDVAIVSYSSSRPRIRELAESCSARSSR